MVFQPNEEAVYVSDIVLHSNDPAHLLRFIPLIGEGTTATGEVLAQPNCPPALVQNCPVTVPVSIDVSGTSPGTNLGSYNATLTWDPNLLAYVGFSGGNEPFDTPIVNEDNTATGELQFEQSDPTGAGSVATIINVEFNVVGDPATGGVLDLEFSEITAGTQNDLLSITTIEDCSFEIAPGCLLGDVTNDAASSGFDALVIATFAVDLPIPPQFLQRIEQGCGDVTLDGNTSGFDALVIATFAVDLPIPDEFPVGEPLCP
ncbi:MAG: cohesin domain-containing protein [Proteobacteria bacterium]|nr:cohesin domain-containing protein [Pseudomonadota bacterium]